MLYKIFGLAFVVWSHRGVHYCVVFTVSSVGTYFLSFSELNDDAQSDAHAHIDFFDHILEIYQLYVKNLAFIVGDNAEVNKYIARRISVPFIGCFSHSLNPAVKKYLLVPYESLLKKVNV